MRFMDVVIDNSHLLSFFLLILSLKILTLKATRKWRSSNKAPKLPPGPWKLPLIGSLHHLLTSPLPHRALDELARRHGPIIHLKLGEVDTVVVSSAAAAAEVMKTNDVAFGSRPALNVARVMTYGLQDVIFAPYGEYWRQLKKTCVLELLSPKRVLSFRSIREDEVNRFTRSIFMAVTVPVNLSQKFKVLMSDITARTVMGNRFKDHATFLEVLSEGVELAAGMDLADLFPSFPLLSKITGVSSKLSRSRQRLDLMFEDIFQERREYRSTMSGEVTSSDEPVDDLLGILLKIHDEGSLTIDGVKAVVFDIFGAGSETSATTMGWVMSELISNPRVMAKAQQEVREAIGDGGVVTEAEAEKLRYLKLVIKETLRLHSPLPLLLPRECRSDCQVLGYDVPKGARMLVNVWAISRDPQNWDEPHAFKPERFDGSSVDFRGANFEYLPFGGGRRICPGIHFGQANMELVLAQLIYYFDWELPLPAGSKLDMDEGFGVTAGRKTDLILRANPRFPCPCR